MEDKEENSPVTGQTELVTTETTKTEPEKVEGKIKPSVKDVVKKVIDKIVKEKADKREFLKQYMERYPDNKTFHVTSDNMVFLEKDLSLARLHQKSMPDGLLDSITVNK